MTSLASELDIYQTAPELLSDGPGTRNSIFVRQRRNFCQTAPELDTSCRSTLDIRFDPFPLGTTAAAGLLTNTIS